MRLGVRVAVVVLSLSALFGLAVHHGATYDDGWPHPTGDQLRDDYDAFVGDRVLVFGEVRAVDADAHEIEIHVTDSADEVAAELSISGVDESVDPGGTVQVYGVLEADRTIHAEEVVVVDRSSAATRYKLVASVGGTLLAVGYFLWHWRPHPRRIAFVPRARSTKTAESETRHRPANGSDDLHQSTDEVNRDG